MGYIASCRICQTLHRNAGRCIVERMVLFFNRSMELVYIIILAVLVAASVYGMVAGVSGDVMRFLKAPCKSKIASARTIKIVACCGIIIGILSAGGVLNVARSGFIHPQYFSFREVMMLYLGVMLSYVLLLDVSSVMRLPISNSVALVFCLFGAAVAVSVTKTHVTPYYRLGDVGMLINSGDAILIIFAILVSVVVAFLLGMAVMYVSRLLFSFRYGNMFGRYGFLWCGMVLAVVACPLVFGAVKAYSLTCEGGGMCMASHWIVAKPLLSFFGAWIVCSAVLRGLQALGVDLLKVTALAGTLFLATAFAGNDLSNFVGVSLAGADAFAIYAAGGGDAAIKMTQLAQPADIGRWVLLGIGLFMSGVIWFSRRKVTRLYDEFNVYGKEKEEERFGNTLISRALVGFALRVNDWAEDHTPRRVHRFINNRFAPLRDDEKKDRSFDAIRLVVNLVCTAVLILCGTKWGLPLSTTYATFMVAMGTSFADKAWDRDGAVSRVTGIMSVISGWFFTSVAALLLSMILTLLLMVGGTVAAAILLVLCLLSMWYMGKIKRRLTLERQTRELGTAVAGDDVMSEIVEEICDVLNKTTVIYQATIRATLAEDRKTLREMVRQSNELYYSAREQKYELLPTLRKLHENDVETGQYYVQVVDYISEITKSLLHIARPCFEHVDNNHRRMSEEQISDLLSINGDVEHLFDKINSMLRTNDFGDLERILEMRDRIFEIISQAVKNQLRRIQAKTTGTKASLLYLTILNETKTIVLQSRNLIKSQSYFVETKEKK